MAKRKVKAKPKKVLPRPSRKVPIVFENREVVEATNYNLQDLYYLNPRNEIVIAYKGIRKSGAPAVHGGKIRYKVGKTYEMERSEVNSSRYDDCGVGFHVATKEWCHDWFKYETGVNLYMVAVRPEDIVALPIECRSTRGTHLGKFRVCRFTIIKQVPWDEQGC